MYSYIWSFVSRKMKRAFRGSVVILSSICVLILSSCGTYHVDNEKQSIKNSILGPRVEKYYGYDFR